MSFDLESITLEFQCLQDGDTVRIRDVNQQWVNSNNEPIHYPDVEGTVLVVDTDCQKAWVDFLDAINNTPMRAAFSLLTGACMGNGTRDEDLRTFFDDLEMQRL